MVLIRGLGTGMADYCDDENEDQMESRCGTVVSSSVCGYEWRYHRPFINMLE
jgi:hypothetical protein